MRCTAQAADPGDRSRRARLQRTEQRIQALVQFIADS
jgi:hypothetical protein